MRRLLATAATAAICVFSIAAPAAADPPGDGRPGPDPDPDPACVGCW